MDQGRRRRSHWGIDCRFRCIPKGYYVQHFSGRGGLGILNRKGKRGNYSAAHLAPQIVIQWGRYSIGIYTRTTRWWSAEWEFDSWETLGIYYLLCFTY